MLAQIIRPPKSCHGRRRSVPHGWIEDEDEDDWSCVQRPPSQQTATARQGSAKEGDHEVKNADEIGGSGSRGVDCGWNLNGRRKFLIFRGLGGFFTIFHSFFTPCFSEKCFVFRYLGKTHGHKRRNNSKWNVENAKRTTNPDAMRAGRVDAKAGGAGTEKLQGEKPDLNREGTRIIFMRSSDPDAARTGRGAEWELTTKAPRAPRAPRLQRRDEDDDDGGYLNCD
jgi:hypothetical protein